MEVITLDSERTLYIASSPPTWCLIPSSTAPSGTWRRKTGPYVLQLSLLRRSRNYFELIDNTTQL